MIDRGLAKAMGAGLGSGENTASLTTPRGAAGSLSFQNTLETPSYLVQITIVPHVDPEMTNLAGAGSFAGYTSIPAIFSPVKNLSM